MTSVRLVSLSTLFLVLLACGDDPTTTTPPDGGSDAAGELDGGPNFDAGPFVDAAPNDTSRPVDAPDFDGGPMFAGAAPVFFGFEVTGAEPTRVYFDSTRPIDGSSAEGFRISGRNIASLTVNAGETTGHYFTVTEPFTFWDNNTIRYEGGGDTGVNPFLMHYIENNIPEPDSPNNLYVATDGDDSNDGTSESSAFQTLHRALELADAGTTVWVKAGRYLDERHEVTRSGSVDAPIKIIGYRTTPGDIESMYYDFDPTAPAPDLDASQMPLFDGEDSTTYGLVSVDQSYLIVRNLQFSRFFIGVTNFRGVGHIVDNSVFKDMYGDGSEEGAGVQLGVIKDDGAPYALSNNRVTNSIAINGGIGNIFVIGAHNLVDGCRTFGDRAGGTFGPDYYITVSGDHSIVRNSTAEKLNAEVNTSSHGIGAKGTEHNYSDWGSPSSYNLFENNYSMGSQECFYSRNTRADYNVFRDNEAAGFGTGTNDGLGISNQTGAQHNTYERMYLHDLNAAFRFVVGTEGGMDPENLHTSFNVVQNSVVENVAYISRFSDVSGSDFVTFEGNRVYNSTFRNVESLGRGAHENTDQFRMSDNRFVNCILLNVRTEGDTTRRLPAFRDMFSIEHSNFFGGLEPPSWASTSSFLDPALDADMRPTSDTPNRIRNEGVDVAGVYYDYDGRERSPEMYSIGAFEMD